ncbi:hypothetical protein MCOR25_001098 [Pyricularia grisea]|nr:hypothetical protein MCOR25_001098 [Pyricularia grisea]
MSDFGSGRGHCAEVPEYVRIMIERNAKSLSSTGIELAKEQSSKWNQERDKAFRRCGIDEHQETQDFQSTQALKPQDPNVVMRLAEAENYDSAYFRYGRRATEGENISDGERVQAFPFHVENGGNLFTGMNEQPGNPFFQVLGISELRSRILKDTSFIDKKNLALTSKGAYMAVSHFYEVWDVTRADFLGNDCGLLQIGTMDDDQRPVVVKSSRVSLIMERAFGTQGLGENQTVRTHGLRGNIRDRLVRDNMMPPSEPILLYTKGSSEIDHGIEARTEARHIMMTAIPLKATAETYSRSPRLTYQNSSLHMLRGCEAIYNVGASIETLDISCQPMLTLVHVDLVLSAVPNLKRLTLRKNHLLRISDTKQLMEMVHHRVPGCILDFAPYFFYGALHRDILNNFNISKGSFGLTWEDSGVRTEKLVALFVFMIRLTEIKLGMRVLDKGMLLRDFLNRLPLRPGFVESVIGFWDDPELGVTGAGINWKALHQIVEPDTSVTSWEQKILACRHCGIRTPQFLMHAQNCCTFCSFQFFANAETDRYRQEKEDIANLYLPNNTMQSTLGMLLGAEELPAFASANGAVMAKGFWDESVGPWTPTDTSNLEQQLMAPILRCRKLYKIRLRDLSWAYNKTAWVPTTDFTINCRKPGFQERGPGDHEFFPVQHDNVLRNQRRIDIHTGESYQVAFLPDEFDFSSQKFYVRAGDWDKLRVDFTKSDKELREEHYRQMYLPW